MDQAFVKAFARSHRPGQNPPNDIRLEAKESADSPPGVVRPPQRPDRIAETPGVLQVDRSVAQTTKIWVDPMEEQVARADLGDPDVPRPHVDAPTPPHVDTPTHPGVAPVAEAAGAPPIRSEPDTTTGPPADPAGGDPWQHVHTAYATVFAEPAVGSYESMGPAQPAGHRSPEAVTQGVDVAPRPRTPQVESTHAPKAPSPPVPSPEADRLVETRIDPPEVRTDAPPSLVPFQAVWEVDVFDVPTLIADLFFAGSLFQQIAERMSEAVSSGLNSVLVTSANAGEGRSTVAIGMAMAAAASGIRVALVDADIESPTLADDLRLELQYGWVDTVRGGLPIKEIAVCASRMV